MKPVRIVVSLLAFAALAGFGCQPETSIDPNVEQLGRATGPAAGTPSPKAMTPPPPVTKATHTGKVEEVINVPRYTYLRLKTADGAETWAAVPTVEVEVGNEVTIFEQMVQKAFKSPSLDRTFETLVFGTLKGGPAPQQAEGELPTGHPPVEDIKTAPQADGQLPAGHPPIGAKKDKPADKPKPEGHPPVI